MKNKALKKAKDWFDIGDNEFGFAYSSLKDRHDEFYAQVCFMFHQSIEKYLKGYLAAKGGELKKIHDLGYLCKQCILFNKEFEYYLEDCKKMNKYYIASRYPQHWPIARKSQSQEAHKIAEKVIGFIKKDLKL